MARCRWGADRSPRWGSTISFLDLSRGSRWSPLAIDACPFGAEDGQIRVNTRTFAARRSFDGFGGEFGGAAEDHFEHVGFVAGGPEFEGGVGGGGDLDGDGVAADDGVEGLDVGVVAAVEAVGDAEDAGEFPDGFAVWRRRGRRVIAVGFFGGGAAVIAGDVGDDFDFDGRKAVEVAVFDEVVRVFVVGRVADVPADVVE